MRDVDEPCVWSRGVDRGCKHWLFSWNCAGLGQFFKVWWIRKAVFGLFSSPRVNVFFFKE